MKPGREPCSACRSGQARPDVFTARLRLQRDGDGGRVAVGTAVVRIARDTARVAQRVRISATRLDDIAVGDLEELLVEAWLARAPKRLAAEYLDASG